MSNNVVALKSGGQIAPIIPQTIEEVFRLSQGIAASGLAPNGMNKPEQITVAIMTGMELGLPPMFSIQKIAVINGRPSIWGDAIPALLWSRGFKIKEWMSGTLGANRVAFCEVTRPDGIRVERTFSENDATRAGLLNKAGPWKQYPDRMLQMRARGYACRDGAADVLSGLYLREELEESEQPVRDITPRAPIMLDIPDAEQPASESASEPEIPEEQAALWLQKLADDLEHCDSVEELEQLKDSNAPFIARLPQMQRVEAERMIAEAAE